MQALIVNPKAGTVYTSNSIPLELYTEKHVKKVVVKAYDKILYSKSLNQAGYFADQLSLSPEGLEDMELVFEFYDQDHQVIKTECLPILASSSPLVLPKLAIEVTPAGDLNAATHASVKTRIENRAPFSIKGDLKVSFNTHLGWKIGPEISVSLDDQSNKNLMTTEHFFPIPADCWVVNASAGVAVQYGKFTFRIHDSKLVFRGDWAKEISHK